MSSQWPDRAPGTRSTSFFSRAQAAISPIPPSKSIGFLPENTPMSIQTTHLAIFLAVVSVTLAAQDAPPAPANAVPQGTIALIQLTDRLDTHTAKAGDHFQARLAEPMTAANGAMIEAGRKIKGHVSAIMPGLRTRL